MIIKNKLNITQRMNPWITWVILQQSLAAVGTWSVARAIHAIQEEQEAHSWIFLSLLGILLPYVPGLFARRAIKKWELSLQKSWIDTWLNRLRGRLDLYNDAKKRDHFLMTPSTR